MNPALARILAEQAELALVPASERTFLWWLGLQDLIAEECLLRLEGQR